METSNATGASGGKALTGTSIEMQRGHLHDTEYLWNICRDRVLLEVELQSQATNLKIIFGIDDAKER